MIAKYNFESKIDDSIRGQVLHQDGISLGGDQLVKRLLEVDHRPRLRRRPGPGRRRRAVALRPEVPRNREIRAQRVNWINRLFVPLAQAYLNNAADDVTDADLPHRSRLVDPVVVESLQKVCDKLRGPGYYNAQQELDLVFDRSQFEGVVYDVFDELLFDFCRRIVDHEADVVLLAGLPSKLELHPATGEDVRAAVALADRAHAQPLCRQLVSLPGREGPQPGRDRRSRRARWWSARPSSSWPATACCRSSSSR